MARQANIPLENLSKIFTKRGAKFGGYWKVFSAAGQALDFADLI